MKYKIQITSSNPKTVIRDNERMYHKKDYYDLITINCNILPNPFRLLMNKEKLTENDKNMFKFYFYNIYERRNDCWHYMQIRQNGKRKPVFEIGFGVR